MSLHRVRTRLRKELAEHEAGARDGHEPTAEAHRVFARHLAEDLAAVDSAIDGEHVIEKTLRDEIARLRALPAIATCDVLVREAEERGARWAVEAWHRDELGCGPAEEWAANICNEQRRGAR